MTSTPDVLIIGGGVIGLSTASLLAKAGVRVEVLDRGPLGMESSWAGAGIIPPGNPDRAKTPFDRLRALSAVAFPDLSRELLSETGIDNGYRVCGGIQILDPSDSASVPAWEEEGFPFQRLTGAALTAIEPVLVEPAAPVYDQPTGAQVRNPRHMQALVAICRSRGVGLYPDTPVAAIEHRANKVTGVRLADGTLKTAGRYLLAAGAWSEAFLESIGLSSGIHPVRGQIVLLKMPAPIFRRVIEWGKEYLVPREDGHILLGSTEEPEVGFVKGNTVKAVKRLLTFALALVPELKKAEIIRCWSGFRPGTRDGLPVLGPAGEITNLFIASGHFRSGLQLSPATAQVMCELLTDRPVSLPLNDFRPGRLDEQTRRQGD